MSTKLKRLRDRDQRGAALVEFAITVPIFIALLALIFDAGLGYSASRSSSSAARSSALVASRAGESRDADFRALDALRAEFGKNNRTAAEIEAIVDTVIVYRSDAGSDGSVPTDCVANGKCNVYNGFDVANLNAAAFTTAQDPITGEDICGAGSPDENWCPLGRRADEGNFLGVFVKTKSEAAVGIGTSDFDLEDTAVFSMYFLPEPTALTPTPTP